MISPERTEDILVCFLVILCIIALVYITFAKYDE